MDADAVTSLLLRDVEVGDEIVDVRIDGSTITAIGPGLSDQRADVDESIDGGGGALLPGLWDHHVHLLSAAAARRSVAVGPEEVAGLEALGAALARAPEAPDGWVRAIGYHESVAGPLDRDAIDDHVADRPVRIQHRSGALWILNTVAVDRLGLGALDDPTIERRTDGTPTGRIFGGDDLLRSRLPDDPPDLARVGADLAALGVVGVTDATPTETEGSWSLLADARRSGSLPQHVLVTGGPERAAAVPPEPLRLGPVKVYLADHDLPPYDTVVDAIGSARDAGRAVAFHSVTRASLVLALAALDGHPSHPGDRIEHGAVIPVELVDDLARRGLTVVTQPGFVTERGDRYLDEVDVDDLPHLYRCRSLLEAGVRVAFSTDQPFSSGDPWAAIEAATGRRTTGGRVVGYHETVEPKTALDRFLGTANAPGGSPRTVANAQPADLCLLDRPLAEQLAAPTAAAVAVTIIDGRVVHRG